MRAKGEERECVSSNRGLSSVVIDNVILAKVGQELFPWDRD